MNTVFLTRHNLLTLLSKLDRCREDPNASSRTIIKYDTEHAKYACTTATICIAVEDKDYYKDRLPGGVYPEDDPTKLPS